MRLTAKGDLKGVKIDDSLYKPSEKEILEDLLVAAHADARRKAEAVMQEKMKGLTGGLPLPPGMNLCLMPTAVKLLSFRGAASGEPGIHNAAGIGFRSAPSTRPE